MFAAYAMTTGRQPPVAILSHVPMLRGSGHIGWWGRTGLALVAFALLVRIMVPAGFMAAPDDLGRAGIVICTGDGTMSLSVDADGTVRKTPLGDDHRDKSQGDHPCAFAGAATPLDQPHLTLVRATFVATSDVQAARPAHQRPGLGLAAPPPPTTGPPVRI